MLIDRLIQIVVRQETDRKEVFNMDYYAMAQQLFGSVPVGCEFIYLIVAIFLFLATVFMVIFPAIFLCKVCKS